MSADEKKTGDPEVALLRQRRIRTLVGYTIAIVLFVILIEIGHSSLPPYLFPSTQQILANTVVALTEEWADLLLTVFRLIVTLLTATALGWLLGLLMGAFRSSVGLVAMPILSILQAIPAVSWILVASLWIAEPEIRIWLICFGLGLPLYAISVYEGVRDLDGELLEAVEQFRPTKWQVIYILLIPQSFVYLLISMRTVSSLVLRVLVFAELVGASSGVGARMGDAQTNFEMPMIFAWTVIMVVLNFVMLWLMDVAERYLLSWRREVAIR